MLMVCYSEKELAKEKKADELRDVLE